MIKQVYVIFDLKSGYYMPDLMTFENDDVAKRWFDSYLHSVLDSNPNAPIVMYPSDFELRCLGTFDFYDAITAVYDSPKPICKASTFIIKEV